MTSRTSDDLRRLADAGVLDVELVERAERDFSGLALCWCGFDMPEHNVDAIEVGDGANAPIQDHRCSSCGTRRLRWLLGAADDGADVAVFLEHDHADDQLAAVLRRVCVHCRLEAAR